MPLGVAFKNCRHGLNTQSQIISFTSVCKFSSYFLGKFLKSSKSNGRYLLLNILDWKNHTSKIDEKKIAICAGNAATFFKMDGFHLRINSLGNMLNTFFGKLRRRSFIHIHEAPKTK